MPGWLGPWEILIVVVIILLIFGGRLLPRLGRSLGSSFTGLKKGAKEGGEEFKTAIKEDEEPPLKTRRSTLRLHRPRPSPPPRP